MSQHIVDYYNPQNKQQTIQRDLNQSIAFVDEAWVGATFTPVENRTQEQINTLDFSTSLVSEFETAQTIVIGTPIYNFTIPASFKAWIDMICRVGLTFKYTETGPVGLLENKKIIIAIASGGVKIGSDYDFASPYLKQVFGFVGITDVPIIDSNAFDLDKDSKSIQTQLAEVLS
jgi:FMN-dependent NADH-azoreductase